MVFASNIMNGAENAARDVGNGIQALVDDAGNAVQNAGNGISNMMNDWSNDANNAEDDVMHDDEGNTGNVTPNTLGGAVGGDYTATRTGSIDDAVTANHTIVWVILAVAAAIIIALVWYYAAQNKNDYNSNE